MARTAPYTITKYSPVARAPPAAALKNEDGNSGTQVVAVGAGVATAAAALRHPGVLVHWRSWHDAVLLSQVKAWQVAEDLRVATARWSTIRLPVRAPLRDAWSFYQQYLPCLVYP